MAFQLSEVEHNYPKNIHILNNGYLNTLLTKISQAKTIQPHFNSLLSQAYRELLIQVLNNEWPLIETECATRMTAMHPEQKYKGTVFDDQQKAVCVDVARAGMVPSQVIFDMINHFTQGMCTKDTNSVHECSLTSIFAWQEHFSKSHSICFQDER